MTQGSLWMLGGLLIALIIISAFFSGSETGMMSINRYRLRHLARKKNRSALRVQQLLDRTDKLLSVILIGNTLANLFASSLATVIAYQLAGEWGIFVGTVVLSIIVLVFAEVTPKTIAATYPSRIAFMAAVPLKILLILFYPAVWLVTIATRGILKIFGVVTSAKALESLTGDELRTLVQESNHRISDIHQDMLLRILDLEKMTVDDVMIPRHQISGIELNQPWETIHKTLTQSKHTRLPVYNEEIDHVLGILNLRKVIPHLHQAEFKQEALGRLAEEIYFVPESTPLTTQLLNFRREKQKIALVVDEYGDIIGLVTIEDILEEIVGELMSEEPSVSKLVKQRVDGRYLVAGHANLRELNRLLSWELPVDGPRTLSGLIIEYLEAIPTEQTCLKLNNYPIEIVKVEDNLVKQAILMPPASEPE